VSGSAVGVLPKEWRATPLKYLASSSGGMTPSKDRADFWDGDVPWVSPKDMKKAVLDDSTDHVSEAALHETGLKLHPPEGVMVVVRGMILAHTFPVARNAVPVTVNQDMKVLRPVTGVDSRYLAWMLQGLEPVMLSMTDESAHGTKTLRTDQWANLAVPVPNASTQEVIANVLDEQTARIDELIAEKRQLRAAVSEYASAEISRLLMAGTRGAELIATGRAVLPKAPAGWRVSAFKRALLGMNQGWSPQCENRPAEHDEWGVLKVGCVNGTAFNPRENKALPPDLQPDLSCVLKKNDVLVSRANTRELVGMAALVEDEHPNLLLCDKLYRLELRTDWVLPAFAVLALRSESARRQIELGASGASSSMQNISQDVLRELIVAFPPVGEQRDIVRQASVVRQRTDSLLKHVDEHVDRLCEYRSSLISAAVTGQLDVGTYKEAA